MKIFKNFRYSLDCKAVFRSLPHIAYVPFNDTCFLMENDTDFGDSIEAKIEAIRYVDDESFEMNITIDVEAESNGEAMNIIDGILNSGQAWVKVYYAETDICIEASIVSVT